MKIKASTRTLNKDFQFLKKLSEDLYFKSKLSFTVKELDKWFDLSETTGYIELLREEKSSFIYIRQAELQIVSRIAANTAVSLLLLLLNGQSLNKAIKIAKIWVIEGRVNIRSDMEDRFTNAITHAFNFEQRERSSIFKLISNSK